MLLTGVVERQEDFAVARQLPSLSELQVGALTVGTTSYVLTCASLAAKMSSDSCGHVLCETGISILICATPEMSISEPLFFPGTQSPSLYVMDAI